MGFLKNWIKKIVEDVVSDKKFVTKGDLGDSAFYDYADASSFAEDFNLVEWSDFDYNRDCINSGIEEIWDDISLIKNNYCSAQRVIRFGKGKNSVYCKDQKINDQLRDINCVYSNGLIRVNMVFEDLSQELRGKLYFILPDEISEKITLGGMDILVPGFAKFVGSPTRGGTRFAVGGVCNLERHEWTNKYSLTFEFPNLELDYTSKEFFQLRDVSFGEGKNDTPLYQYYMGDGGSISAIFPIVL